MDKVKITLRNGNVHIVDIPNKERFGDYVEQRNDKRARFWVSELSGKAINLDLIDLIELYEDITNEPGLIVEKNSPILITDKELDF